MQNPAAKTRSHTPRLACTFQTGYVLVQDAAETPAEAHQSTTAEELKQIYSSLVGHGFQHADIQAALKAVQPVLANTALDWLCMHVPPDRLPARFAGA